MLFQTEWSGKAPPRTQEHFLNSDWNGMRERATLISGKGAFQAEGTASAKILRWKPQDMFQE